LPAPRNQSLHSLHVTKALGAFMADSRCRFLATRLFSSRHEALGPFTHSLCLLTMPPLSFSFWNAAHLLQAAFPHLRDTSLTRDYAFFLRCQLLAIRLFRTRHEALGPFDHSLCLLTLPPLSATKPCKSSMHAFERALLLF
jgi:hypothetical protein